MWRRRSFSSSQKCLPSDQRAGNRCPQDFAVASDGVWPKRRRQQNKFANLQTLSVDDQFPGDAGEDVETTAVAVAGKSAGKFLNLEMFASDRQRGGGRLKIAKAN